MFLRIKRIKGKEYAYLSENKWMKRSGKVKQITRKYLGRVVRQNIVSDIDFLSYYGISDVDFYIQSNERTDILQDLLKWELHRHGFKEVRNIWRKGDLYVNIRLKKVLNGENPVALGMNEGYLTGYTISRLLRYQAYVAEDAYELAKIFVESGIAVPQELFIGVFGKYNIEEYQ